MEREHQGGTADIAYPESTTDKPREREIQPLEEREIPRDSGRDVPLLSEDVGESFRSRWSEVQTSFVDEPRDSVKRADELVAELIQHLAAQFADERSTLESQWDSGGDVSTEDLRLALQRYRSFFDRLLRV